MSESKIAIIPARGGSKRIPRKNIKEFLGKPIISYSIRAALDSGLFDQIMVSTDDEEIAEVALKSGAQIPFMRSQKNSDDFATTIDVINEVLENYRDRGLYFSYGCCIYATAPLIDPGHLIEGYCTLKNLDFDTVLPVVPFSYPIWRGLEIIPDGKVKMIWPEYLNSRSQDLRSVFHDAGQWYWFNPLRVKSSLFTPNSGFVVVEEQQVQDIDNTSDWLIAEMKYRLRYGG